MELRKKNFSIIIEFIYLLKSVSGPSATVFAYLGEFHADNHRSKVIMLGNISAWLLLCFKFILFSGSTMYAASCFWNPVFASIIINQEWSFYIAALDLVFKPWRLFMIICGMPNIVCGLVMLFCLPESPKFTYSNGDEAKTLKILRGIYSINTGKPEGTYEVTSLVKDSEFQGAQARKAQNLLHFMWSQTAPLFRHPHLRNTLTICFIQFCIFNSSNGFWSFFPEITNRITIWKESDPSHLSSTICEILDDTKIVKTINGTFNETVLCVNKLEPSAFINVYILNSIYFFGWFFISTIITCAGKLVIITTLLFSSGICGFALIFISHPIVANYVYIGLLSVGLALAVLSAATVELFPTQFRFELFFFCA